MRRTRVPEHLFQKRSKLSRYIQKMFQNFQVPNKNVRLERPNVPERIPGTFQVRSRTRSKNCSSVPHRSRYGPCRSGMGGRKFYVYNSPNFSMDCTIFTEIDYEEQVESQERSSCHRLIIFFQRLFRFYWKKRD